MLKKIGAFLILATLIAGCENGADNCMRSADAWHQHEKAVMLAKQGELEKFIATMDPHKPLPGLGPFVMKPDGSPEVGPNGFLEVEIKDETMRKSREQWDAAAKELTEKWQALIGPNFPYGYWWKVQQEMFDKKILEKKMVDADLAKLEQVYLLKLSSCKSAR